MMPLRIGLPGSARIPTGKTLTGKILAATILLALPSAATAQAPAIAQRGGSDAFNVLDQVEVDPRTQRINLVGHYDPAFAGPAIPYAQFLATLLDNPTPRFSLDPAPGALAAAQAEVSKRVNTRADWQQMFTEWGDWLDADDRVTPVGRVFLRAFGVWPLPDFASGDDPWAKADRHQLLARIFATAGNVRAAAILEAYGAVRRAGSAVAPEQLRELLAAAEVAANADSTAAAVKRGILSAQQGLAETYGAFFRKLDETFDLNGVTVQAFESFQRTGTAIPASIDAGLREFDRQFQTIYRGALVKLWETRAEVHIPLSEITPSLRDTAKASPRYIDLDPKSLLAKLMFEADVFLKYLGHMPELAEKIPAYRSEFMFDLERPRSGSLRYWISIEEVAASRSTDGNILALAGATMRINARAIDPNTGDDLPDTGLGGYGLLLTSLYDDLARVFPQYFHALREAGKLSYAAQWLKARDPGLRLPRQGRIVWNGPADVSAVVILFMTPIEPRPGVRVTGTAIEGGVDGAAPTPDANIAKDRGVKPASGQAGCNSVTTGGGTAFFGIGGSPAVTLTDCASAPPLPSAITIDTKAKSPPAKAAAPTAGRQPTGPRPPPAARPIAEPAIRLPEPPGDAVAIQGTVPRMPAWSPPKLKPTPPPPPLQDAEPDPCKSRGGTAFFGMPANPTGADLGCDARPLASPPPDKPKPEHCAQLKQQADQLRRARSRFNLMKDVYQRRTQEPASTADVPQGFELVSYAELRQLFPKRSDDSIRDLLGSKSSNYHAAIYKEQGTGKIVVAFAGTENADDWFKGNVPQGAGEASEYYIRALAIARLLANSRYAKDHGVEFVGHSLGGGLASAAAMAVCSTGQANFVATIVNAAGVHRDTARQANFGKADECVYSYITEGEPLNALQDHREQTLGVLGATASVASAITMAASLPQFHGRRLPTRSEAAKAAAELAKWVEQKAGTGAFPRSVNRDNAKLLPVDWRGAPLPLWPDRHSMDAAIQALDNEIHRADWERDADCPTPGAPTKAEPPKNLGELRRIVDRQVDWQHALRDLARMAEVVDEKGTLTRDDLAPLRLDNLRAAYRAVAGLRNAARSGRAPQDALQLSEFATLMTGLMEIGNSPLAALPVSVPPFAPLIGDVLAQHAVPRQNALRFLRELEDATRRYDRIVPFEKVMQTL